MLKELIHGIKIGEEGKGDIRVTFHHKKSRLYTNKISDCTVIVDLVPDCVPSSSYLLVTYLLVQGVFLYGRDEGVEEK